MCHCGPRGLGLLLSEGEGSKDDPPFSHLRFSLELSVSPPTGRQWTVPLFWGYGLAFQWCTHTPHALPTWDPSSLTLTRPRLPTSWDMVHIQWALRHRAKS